MAEVAHTLLQHSQARSYTGMVAVARSPPQLSHGDDGLKPLIIRITVMVRAQAVQQWVMDEHTCGEFVQPQFRLPREAVVSP